MLFDEYLRRKDLTFHPDVEPDIFLERERLKAELESKLNSLVSTKSKVQLVFHGDTDSGKTHILKFIRSKLHREHHISSIELDLRYMHSPTDIHAVVVSYLEGIGFIERLLDFIVKCKDDKQLYDTIGDAPFQPSWKAMNQDRVKIKDWIEEGTKEIEGNQTSTNVVWERRRKVLAALLRSFFVLNDRTYSLFLIDHIEILLDDLTSYILNPTKKEMLNHLAIIMRFSSFFASIDSEWHDHFIRVFSPDSSRFRSIHVPPFNSGELNSFFKEIRDNFVDTVSIEKVRDLAVEGEKATILSFPLTEEAFQLVGEVGSVQPGTLTNILDDSLKGAMDKRSTCLITRVDIKRSIERLAPELLIGCRNCHTRLSKINAKFYSRGSQKFGSIAGIVCPKCGSRVSGSLETVLRRIVPDTSSLADGDVSMLLNYMPNLIKNEEVRVFIPAAAFSEISSWDKKKEKYDARFAAYTELQNLQNLSADGTIILNLNVGRVPTVDEIRIASLSNPIDKIIIDVAKINNATLLTHDNDMAANGMSKLKFTILFIEIER